MKESATHVAIRLYPSEKKLAKKLKQFHGLAGLGRLFSKYMRDDVAKIKQTTKES